ncbi:hypothetical protein JCM10908_004573 [Rhodotorula pacifica]|uniref:uncharacterized protein n=1 Tax=Rhodotorula pacifica TaxID=1495444 RepID=UPI0031779288
MLTTKPPEYQTFVDLRRAATAAREPNEAVVHWLEEREPVPSTAAASPRASSSTISSSNAAPSTSITPTASTSNAIHRPDPPLSRPGPQKTPSFPTTSLAERMAALRASGLSGATSSAPPPSSRRPSATSPPDSPQRPPSPPLSGPSRTLRQSATPVSPSASPRIQKGDLVADDAIERSGSAPPILPYSQVQEPAKVWEESALQFRPDGGAPIGQRTNGVSDRGPAGGVDVGPTRSRTQQEDAPSSPSGFDDAFPSLDDFERRIDPVERRIDPADLGNLGPSRTRSSTGSSSLFQLPSVPTSDPGSAPHIPAASSSATQPSRRAPPPHPPKPQYLDEQTFRREQQERADAMAKRAAGLDSTPLSTSPHSMGRNELPSALVPGRSPAPPPQPLSGGSGQAALPPPAEPRKGLKIPFATEVRPLELWQYIQTSKAESGEGPRVLLLDLRSREEYERGRVRGETVCLEPIVLRNGVRSADIEDALCLSPPQEAALFSARNRYDIVVIYDRSSAALPTTAPTSTSSDAQRTLWNLVNAIYEREFSKHLARQPILLRGGWEAWEKQVGSKGCVGTHILSGSAPDLERSEAKKANRRATVVSYPGENGHLVNGHAPSSSAGQPASPYQPSPVAASVMSPRLAMPPVAAQRYGPAPEYDPFTTAPTPTPSSSRPSYPQPQLNGYGYGLPGHPPVMGPSSAYSSDLHAAGSNNMAAYVNGDFSRAGSADYSRPSIDYPQLQSRPPPPIADTTRPPARSSSYDAVQSAGAVARPPPARPAPPRLNSSFSSMQPAQYSAAHSNFPTSLLSFDEGIVGLSGLKNLGNTCYMNSTIQCLSAAVPFARYFTGGAYRKDINVVNPLGTKGALANAVAELIRMLWAQQYHFLSPVTFREAICRVAPQFRGSEQHDAQEFLGFLLDGLHEDCNYVVHKPPPIDMTPEREHDLETLPPQVMSEREWQIYKMRNDSFIVQCFQGQFRNQMRCLTCQKTSTTYNTFMPLSVPIPGGRGIHKVSLMACLETFVRDEILDRDDAWHCPRCKKERKSVKKLSLSKLPPILVIHLKRFSFHGPFSDKLETQVQYPLTGLDLTPFLPPPLYDKRGQGIGGGPPNGYVYDLFGVTNHYGNLSSGHYTAFVRSGKEWFNIGDSKVTPCNPKVVESAKSAYILYYTLRA